ncbi:hypothetical protein [Pseudoalteromonas luteoviolacea]|uniref:Uncharacterized protein n=1 Tax=Pseudoalteromonas luteoviolacea H33 TaxID=1365251 RepID=A0A167ARM5_9GAMM|nr:hypothetical protein [Pseudoalteromonas luteoviolacea]KZN45719.1 hypothetical protein N476_25165 [Pseudoalteromonas luteoviolacea H33]KZN73976.1 hypothetical protein N477_22540 [Pseudoalteromonas luteoviolacea H33-S]MBQ4878116.1 hypothetical protein [Pseudoalteromonas luteoviolacea]MBQ4907030.1 hypothetical protein [Pseudoalteromonas luteoviolacea]
MSEKSIFWLLNVVSFLNFSISLNFINSDFFLSVFLFSGGWFFLFLSKNPRVLLSKNVQEVDRLIPGVKGVGYLFISVFFLILNVVYYLV